MKVMILGKRKPPDFDPTTVDEKVCSAAQQRNLVVLAGAGISRQAKNASSDDFPNWIDLLVGLNNLNASLERSLPTEVREIDELIDRGEFLMAAQQLQKRLPKQRYEEYLKKKFEPYDVYPGDIHDAIIRLNPPFVLTTNYDSLFETALNKVYKGGYNLVFTGHRSDLVLARYKEAKSSRYPFILKIHGTITDLDSIVLTQDSYVELYNRHDFQDLLASVFLNYVVLMIGFSLSDPEMLHFLSALHIRFNRRLPRSFLFTSDIKGSSVKAQRLEEDFGVQVITYPRSAHSQVLDLINYLSELADENTKTASADDS